MKMTCRFTDSEWARRVSRTVVAVLIVTGAMPGGVATRIAHASDVTPPEPPPVQTPIVGFGDTHLHQHSNFGFGGIDLWGAAMDPTGDPSLFGTSDSDPLRIAARRRALPDSDYIYVANADVSDYLGPADIPVTSLPTTTYCDNGNCSPKCPPGTGVPGNACWRIEIQGVN